jgi:hypothetical protein
MEQTHIPLQAYECRGRSGLMLPVIFSTLIEILVMSCSQSIALFTVICIHVQNQAAGTCKKECSWSLDSKNMVTSLY